MNRFIAAAIENMEQVEQDYLKDPPRLELRRQKTREAIAYALIAIAETLVETKEGTIINAMDDMTFTLRRLANSK